MPRASELITQSYMNGAANQGQLPLPFENRFAEVDAELTNSESFLGGSLYNSVQTAIDAAISTGKQLRLTPGTYNLTSGLIIDGRIDWQNSFQDVILDFSGMTSGVAITIGLTNGINGLNLQGLKIVANTNITAIKINSTSDINKPVVDSVIKNIRVDNAGIGIIASYSWDLILENIRFQNCTKPIEFNSQFNHIELIRCSFVSCVRVGSLTNCEGINFSSCEFANVSDANQYAVTLFQSWVTMINPYIELVPKSLQVGSPTETIPSTCTIKGGIVAGKINIAKDKAIFSIEGSRADYSSFALNAGMDDVGAVTLRKSTATFIATTQPKWITTWYGNSPTPFADAFGGGLTKRLLRDSYEFNHAFANQGIRISNALTVGMQYTLILAIQKTSGITVNLAAGVSNNITNYVSAYDGAFEVVYVPFLATTTTLNLTWGAGSLFARYIGLAQGVFFSDVDIKSPITLHASAVPTAGSWVAGDYIKNSTPVVGSPKGWYCTVSGTPGTWVSEGNL